MKIWWESNQYRGVQIPAARTPRWLHFACWCLLFVGPQCGTSFMSLLWDVEFSGGS